jgi:tetratricopeptide (TPR) repeat protein
MQLARYYATTGEMARALDFYERALTAAPPDSAARLLFEIAQVHESQGNCAEAIGFFRAFRLRAPYDSRAGEAEWHIGNCSFALARRAGQDGDPERALRLFDTVIGLGLPENLVDDAWFERGEILLQQGRREEALSAYQRVLELNRTATGQFVERARRRIDELRFGRGGAP